MALRSLRAPKSSPHVGGGDESLRGELKDLSTGILGWNPCPSVCTADNYDRSQSPEASRSKRRWGHAFACALASLSFGQNALACLARNWAQPLAFRRPRESAGASVRECRKENKKAVDSREIRVEFASCPAYEGVNEKHRFSEMRWSRCLLHSLKNVASLSATANHSG